MESIRFTVLGLAQPKGSARAFPIFTRDALGEWALDPRTGKPVCRVVITSDNPRVKAWQQEVARAAQAALGGVQLEITGAVVLECVFYLPRPASYSKHDTTPPIVRPDLDKLTRAIADAITGIVWRDDSQIVKLIAEKRYADRVAEARVDVTITPALTAGLPLFPDAQEPSHADRSRRPLARSAAAPAVPW